MLNSLRKIISYDNPLRVFWHKINGVAAAVRYSFPGKKLVCIGVTGTNGKTTTAHMIEHILHSAGKKVALMSTVEFAMNGKHWANESKKTTLSPFKTQKFLRKCVKNGIEYVVIESSSHALHQSRLWGIPFSIAAITNITHEHLDYHGTMEKYAQAKKILFEIVSDVSRKKTFKAIRNIPHQNAFILNHADQFYTDFNALKCLHKFAYGFKEGNLQAKKVTYEKYGSHFDLIYKKTNEDTRRKENSQFGEVSIVLKMTGSFNVENALAATGVGLACKLSLSEIKRGLESFDGVAGRMERIKSPKGFEVIVDFALTPDALEKLYSTLKKTSEGRLIGLIGSCGDRDKEKRPDMGKIVANYCDLTIVTDEEPYSEDPKQIMEAVLSGAKTVKTLGKDLLLIEDRKEAMDYAIQHAKKDDVVVVTGMGSFTTRTMNDGPMEWDDREVAKQLIHRYSG